MTKLANVLKPIALTAATTMVAGFAVLQSAPAQAASLITNGDFETGDLSGWTQSGNTSFTGVTGSPGSYVAFMGPIGTNGFLSQIVSTVAGQSYTLTYDLLSDGGFTNNFSAVVNGNTLFSQVNIPAQGFTQYSFNFIATGSDTIQLGFRNDPGFLQLDNVAVNQTVPEPFTIVGTFIGGTAAMRMRKKLKASKKTV